MPTFSEGEGILALNTAIEDPKLTNITAKSIPPISIIIEERQLSPRKVLKVLKLDFSPSSARYSRKLACEDDLPL